MLRGSFVVVTVLCIFKALLGSTATVVCVENYISFKNIDHGIIE